MSYTINSAKDSHGDEDKFMQAFNANLPKIMAYKQQHGGDLEGAFGAVMGTPWPAGRSVKVKNGAGEMTKDRTVKSVLGKYVALPAAIAATAAFAPGALPAIGHAMASGASALTGIGGAAGGAGGVAGGVGAISPMAAFGAGSTAVGGGGIMGALGGAGGFAKLAGMASSMGKTAAANRGTALEASQVQDQINTSRGAEDRASQGDAWKRLQEASYLQNKKGGYANTANLPTFGTTTPFNADPAIAQGAGGMKDEVMRRLMGNSLLPQTTNAAAMSKPGMFEKLMNVAGPAMAYMGGR